MSYVNATITTRDAASVGLQSREITLEAGFSREGGRLDFLTRTTTIGTAEPKVETFTPNAALVAPARGLLDAILGASGVRSVVTERSPFDRAGTTTWSDRSGVVRGTAPRMEVPSAIQAVLDAAELLDSALDAG
jgi:hypothetical protein